MNDGPKHAYHEVGKGRYYEDPQGGPPLISVTTVLDAACAKPALVPWAAKAIAERAMDILPQLVVASRKTDTHEAALKDLKAHVNVVRETAAGLGTRVHAAAEAHLLGRTIPNDPEVAPFVTQYERFLTDWGVNIERDVFAAESTVFNRHEGYAGTLDLMVALPLWPALDGKDPHVDTDGERRLWIVDTKTSTTQPASRYYPEAALQQTAYRHGQVLLMPDGTEIRMPSVAGVAVLNLRTNDYALIPLPGGTDEWAAFQGALKVARWMHAFHDLENKPAPISAAGEVKKPRKRAAKKTTPTKTKAA